MERALKTERAGHWPRDQARGSVTLTYDDRHRRRLRLTSDDGENFLLDLPRATLLAAGDGLGFADGSWIEVKPAPEPLLEVRAASPELLIRVAWHIGNRHVPTQISADRILLRADHVIAAMLEGLGATTSRIEAPFTPERGAYDETHDHDH